MLKEITVDFEALALTLTLTLILNQTRTLRQKRVIKTACWMAWIKIFTALEAHLEGQCVRSTIMFKPLEVHKWFTNANS